MLNEHLPIAIQCIYLKNPLIPHIPWINKIDFTSAFSLSASHLYNTFTSSAFDHWTLASQLSMCNYGGQKLSSHHNLIKKYLYAIQFLDFGRQFLQTGAITDFSLIDDIRTKIHNKTYQIARVFLLK